MYLINVELPDGKKVVCKYRRVDLVLKEFNINENTVLVSSEGSLVTHDIVLEKGSSIKIISVVSGG